MLHGLPAEADGPKIDPGYRRVLGGYQAVRGTARRVDTALRIRLLHREPWRWRSGRRTAWPRGTGSSEGWSWCRGRAAVSSGSRHLGTPGLAGWSAGQYLERGVEHKSLQHMTQLLLIKKSLAFGKRDNGFAGSEFDKNIFLWGENTTCHENVMPCRQG